MHWDLFCRVVDNFGDIGVCWRLAADLGSRGDAVRLWCDDATALAWMAPAGARGVEVRPWPTEDDTSIEPSEAVIEAFGCRLPAGYLRRMAAREPRPAWINLEYLTAEDYAERNHGLLSPQSSGPAQGLDKWFFYPGFSPRTGGLLREPDLARRQAAFDPITWRHGHGTVPAPGERIVSLFCYANAALPALLDALSAQPTLLLVTPGPAAQQVRALLGTSNHGALRVHLPAGAHATRLRPPAVVVRPEPGAGRRFICPRAVGRQAFPVADLSPGRRRARRETRRVPSALPVRRGARPRRGSPPRRRGLERGRRRIDGAWPRDRDHASAAAPLAGLAGPLPGLAGRAGGLAGPDIIAARICSGTPVKSWALLDPALLFRPHPQSASRGRTAVHATPPR